MLPRRLLDSVRLVLLHGLRVVRLGAHLPLGQRLERRRAVRQGARDVGLAVLAAPGRASTPRRHGRLRQRTRHVRPAVLAAPASPRRRRDRRSGHPQGAEAVGDGVGRQRVSSSRYLAARRGFDHLREVCEAICVVVDALRQRASVVRTLTRFPRIRDEFRLRRLRWVYAKNFIIYGLPTAAQQVRPRSPLCSMARLPTQVQPRGPLCCFRPTSPHGCYRLILSKRSARCAPYVQPNFGSQICL